MANTRSAAKSARKTVTRTVRNRSVKTGIKNAVKKFRSAVAEGVDHQAAHRTATSELDRAAKRGVIHRNAANRRKSRLAKLIAAKA